jgi:hypothetical protein
VFRYNTAVLNVNRSVVRNVYVDRTVIVNRGGPRYAFNGPGGVNARASRAEEAAAHERHFERTSNQVSHEQMAGRGHAAGPAHAAGHPQAEMHHQENHPQPHAEAHAAPHANAGHPQPHAEAKEEHKR